MMGKVEKISNPNHNISIPLTEYLIVDLQSWTRFIYFIYNLISHSCVNMLNIPHLIALHHNLNQSLFP
jgi:hypothetical protein